MNFQNDQYPPVEQDDNAPRFSIPVPFLRQQIGAGDVVANMTQAMGVKPCAPCEQRKRAMNQAVVFRPVGE